MASFGEELRRERELRDISLKEISEATKISMRFLEALEQDNFDILPGGIFNRGFIRAYARFIGINGEEMVNAYLHEVSLRQTQQGPGTSRDTIAPRSSRGFSEEVFRPQTIPQVRSNGDDDKPRAGIPFELGSAIRNVSESTAGRTSLILWGLVVIAFVIGASVITMSMMKGPAEASSGDGVPVVAGPSGTGTEQAAVPEDDPEPAAATPGGDTDTKTPAEPARRTTPPENKPAPTPERTAATASASPIVAQPAAPPTRAQIQDLPEPDVSTPPVPEDILHQVSVLATEATHVRIECNGRVALFQELWPGASRKVNCAEPVVLSADNGGAVRYAVDDGPVTLLGRPGQRIHGVTVAPADGSR